MDIGRRLAQLNASTSGGWRLNAEAHLEKDYRFPDFASALAFVNRVGAQAEEQGHHPNITFTWGRVRLEVWTHTTGTVGEKDFQLAAAADRSL
jgi:4a-hydroxytetrahydrobiopterin dehydratase